MSDNPYELTVTMTQQKTSAEMEAFRAMLDEWEREAIAEAWRDFDRSLGEPIGIGKDPKSGESFIVFIPKENPS